MRTLPENYQANIDILKENLRRGMSKAQALSVIQDWERQFTAAGLMGDAEKNFLNQALKAVDLPMGVVIA